MGSKPYSFSAFAFFLSFNLLFSTLITTPSATDSPSNPPTILPPLTPAASPTADGEPVLPPLTPPPSPGAGEKCGEDGIKISMCAMLLDWDLLKVIVGGGAPVTPCCSLMEGLADYEAAACLCAAIKASVLGDGFVDIPISFTLLLINCGGKKAHGFKCS
ncbi:14 kDa proline-rich protein DC2.15-like [Cucurbita moschata]|uniref:14 kDa proline-rich protein DC2.15-like n=1 Tax=Cucurbita moschata TaxID=3662 RepID=A0A6J1E372_CUCMO|nr:14 kDa proline-rich protein DC2.15-like [Cucurbita moschata]